MRNSPNKCGVSAPGTVDGLHSLGGILTVHIVRQSDDERAEAERLLKRLEEKDPKMREKWGRHAHGGRKGN